MRRVAIINQKGGVGKTTTCVNLGAALARAGERVLLIDLDPQSHLTLHLGIDPSTRPGGTYEALTQSVPLDRVRRQVSDNLWMIGSHIDLAAAEVELVSVIGREVILRDLLDAHRAEYDYVLMDCPPSLGVLTLNALAAATEIFIPLQPHYLALHGLSKLLETVSLVARRINPSLRVTGVVVCMHEAGTRLASEVLDDVQSFLGAAEPGVSPWAGARVFKTLIRRNIKLAECPSYGQTIFDYAPHCNGAEDYAALAVEVRSMSGPDARASVSSAESPPVAEQGSPAADAEATSATSPERAEAMTPPGPAAAPSGGAVQRSPRELATALPIPPSSAQGAAGDGAGSPPVGAPVDRAIATTAAPSTSPAASSPRATRSSSGPPVKAVGAARTKPSPLGPEGSPPVVREPRRGSSSAPARAATPAPSAPPSVSPPDAPETGRRRLAARPSAAAAGASASDAARDGSPAGFAGSQPIVLRPRPARASREARIAKSSGDVATSSPAAPAAADARQAERIESAISTAAARVTAGASASARRRKTPPAVPTESSSADRIEPMSVPPPEAVPQSA